MVTNSIEYKEYLASLAQSYSPPNILIRIPANEPVYKIDLDTRNIESPKIIGVEADHRAESLFFIMDRYFNNMDLSTCIGAI